MSEGYRESELGQFAGDAQRFADALLATTPFDENERAINVFRVDVASTDSGADDPEACGGTGATPATFFDATYCGAGIDRLLLVDTETVMETASEAVPEWHVAVVIVNATKYGGSGAAGVPVYSLAADAEKIAIHELGHSGFGLADEYCEAGGDRDRYEGDEPVEPNITADPDRATLKWGAHVLAGTPLPTTTNPDCSRCDPQPSPRPASLVGAFEGAGRFRCGLWRPRFTCAMNDLRDPFCPVCRQRIRETLQPFLPDRSPMNYSVIVNQRNHFGDEQTCCPACSQAAGRTSGSTTGVDPGQQSVLMFQALHVNSEKNIFTVNGRAPLFGLPTTTEDKKAWAAQVLLVAPNTLRGSGNILHVEARTNSGSALRRRRRLRDRQRRAHVQDRLSSPWIREVSPGDRSPVTWRAAERPPSSPPRCRPAAVQLRLRPTRPAYPRLSAPKWPRPRRRPCRRP